MLGQLATFICDRCGGPMREGNPVGDLFEFSCTRECGHVSKRTAPHRCTVCGCALHSQSKVCNNNACIDAHVSGQCRAAGAHP